MTKAEQNRQKKLQEKKLGIISPDKMTLGVTFEIVEYDEDKTGATKSIMSKLCKGTQIGDLITIIYPGYLINGNISYSIDYIKIKITNHRLNIDWSGYYISAKRYLNRILKCKQL